MLADIFNSMNIFGLGPTLPVVIIAAMVALVVTAPEIRERKYSNTGLMFIVSSLMLTLGGIHAEMLVIILFTVIYGIYYFLSAGE